MRKNVLLLTMAISPNRGSEYSVAWNHVKFMSKYHNLHVLYCSSSDQFGDTSEMQSYLREHPMDNVVFHAVPPGKLAMHIFFLKKKLEWNSYARYILYKCFSLWHQDAYRYARKLVKEQQFDLIHYLGPIGYREPGYLWKLGLPYIRGPIGGTYQKPISLFKALRMSDRIIFYMRNIINWWQLNFSIRLRNSLPKTTILLTATKRAQADFLHCHNKESIYLPENSIIEITGLNTVKFSHVGQIIKLIWIGRIDANKALIILLEALARISEKNYILNVVGDDSNMSKRVKEFVKTHDLEANVVFHGAVPRTDVFKLMNDSHLHVISSISEGNPTTVWEAMSVGVPTLTLDHCGMGDVINDRSGKKIRITTYDETIDRMADALSDYLKNPSQLEVLAKSTVEEAQNYTWEKRVAFFNDLYQRF